LKPLTKPTSRIAQAVSKKPAATVVAVEPQLASTTNILTRAARRKSLQLAEGPAAAKPMLRQSVAVNESKLQSVELEQDENKRPKTSAVVNTKQWDDLDADDAGDPVMVSEYVVEIFEYLRKLEVN
jgi:G2/mitotic-specific cyclin 1/2